MVLGALLAHHLKVYDGRASRVHRHVDQLQQRECDTGIRRPLADRGDPSQRAGLPVSVAGVAPAPTYFEVIMGLRVIPDLPIVKAKAALPRFATRKL